MSVHTRSHPSRGWRLPAIALAFALAAQAVGGAADVEIFMTGAKRETQKLKSGKEKVFWVPKERKIASAWSDAPFAFHVTMPVKTVFYSKKDWNGQLREGYTTQGYEVRFHLTGLAYKDPKEGTKHHGLRVLNAGGYNADGKEAFSQELQRSRYTGLPNDDLVPDKPCTGHEGAGFPSVSAAQKCTTWVAVDTGAYGFQWHDIGERVEGTLHVRIWDTETEKKALIAEKAFDFLVKQNGWKITRIENTPGNGWGRPLGSTTSRYTYSDGGVTLGSNALSGTFKVSGQTTERREQFQSYNGEAAFAWKLELPRRMLDHDRDPKATLRIERVRKTPKTFAPPRPLGMNALTCRFHNVRQKSDDEDDGGGEKTTPGAGKDADGEKPRIVGLVSFDAGNSYRTKTNKQTGLLTFEQESGYITRRDEVLYPGWVAEKDIGEQPIGRVEVDFYGARIVGSEQAGRARYDLKLFATRLSEYEGNPAGSIRRTDPGDRPKVPDDGYYTWIQNHGALVRKNMARLGEIRTELMFLRRLIEEEDKRFRGLLSATMESFQWTDLGKGRDMLEDIFREIGESESELRDLQSFDPAPGSLFSWVHKSIGPMEGLTAKELSALKARRTRIRKNIAAMRAMRPPLIKEGEDLIDAIYKSVWMQWKKSGFRHDHLEKEGQHWDDYKVTTRLSLYEDAGMWKEMDACFQRYHFGTKATQEVTRLMSAKRDWQLAGEEEQKEWFHHLTRSKPLDKPVHSRAVEHKIRAMESLRDLLELNPENLEGQEMLLKVDVAFLNMLGKKLWNERQVSDAMLRKYLSERGLNPQDVQGDWAGFFEYAYAFWSWGPMATISGWTVEALGETNAHIQTDAARNQVTLLAIRRLRQQGVPLEKIRDVTLDMVKTHMPFQTPKGAPLPEVLRDRRVAQLSEDIRQTFLQLKDLQALAERDAEKLTLAFGKSYYRPHEAINSWPEYIGDAFSFGNILSIFGPGAVAKVGGKWQKIGSPFGAWRGGTTRLLAQGKKVEYLDDVAMSALKLDRLGLALQEKKLAGPVVRMLQRDMQMLRGLSAVEQAGTTATHAVASMFLMSGVQMWAEANNLPALNLLVDILGELSPGQVAAEILGASGETTRKLLAKVDLLDRKLQAQRKRLTRRAEILEELEEIRLRRIERAKDVTPEMPAGGTRKPPKDVTPEMPAGGTRKPPKDVTPEMALKDDKRLDELAEEMKTDQGLHPDGTSAAADSRKCITRAIAAVQDDTPEVAERAVAAAKAISKVEEEAQQTAAVKLTKARRIVESTSNVSAKAVERMGKERRPVDMPDPDTWRPTRVVDKNGRSVAVTDYDAFGDAATALKKGDEELSRDELDLAVKSYQDARKLVDTGDADRIRFINLRTRKARNALSHAAARQKKRANAGKPAYTKFIDDDETDRVAQKLANNEWNIAEAGDPGKSPLYEITDQDENRLFLFKTPPARDADSPLLNYDGELVGDELGAVAGDLLDVPFPATRKATLGVPDGGQAGARLPKEGVLMRFVPGRELMDVEEDILIAIKGEYAEHVVLRAWLGDYDIHLRNSRIGEDGTVHMIDTGLASWRHEDNPLRLLGSEASPDGALSHAAMTAYAGRLKKEKGGLYVWPERMAEMIDYQELMSPMVDKIKKLCKDETKLKAALRKIMGERKLVNGKRVWVPNEAQVQEAFEILKQRSEELEEALRKRYPMKEKLMGHMPGLPLQHAAA